MIMLSCVDDKESAIVEQLRTAKTTWLQAQADLLKAQGEAQKILAETEKMKAENEAKRDAAQQEIDKLLAQAEAAKSEAEAEKLKAEADQIKAEIERETEKFQLEMQQKQLAYELAVLQNDVRKMELQKQLNALESEMKQNPVLKELYANYVIAIEELNRLNGQVATRNQTILGLENSYNQSVERYETILNDALTNAQEELKTAQENLDKAQAADGMSFDAITAKIKELEAQLPTIIKEIDEQNAEMINNFDDYRALVNTLNEKKAEYAEQRSIYAEAEVALNDAIENKANAEVTRKNAQSWLQSYGYPGVPQSYEGVKKGIKDQENRIAEQTKKVEKYTQALADSTAMIASVDKKLVDARNEYEALQQDRNELYAKRDANYELITKANDKIAAEQLDSKADETEATRKAAAQALIDAENALKLLTPGSAEYTAQEKVVTEKQKAFDDAEKAAKKAKEALDAQNKIINDATEANKPINKSIDETNEKISKVEGLIYGYWDNGQRIEGLQSRLQRLRQDTREGELYSNGYPNGGGKHWHDKAWAEYVLTNNQNALSNLNEQYNLAISTDADFDKAIADAEADMKSKEPDYTPVEEAEKAIEECAYMAAKNKRAEEQTKKYKIEEDIKIYKGQSWGTSTGVSYKEMIAQYEEKVQKAQEEVQKAEEAVAEYAALTREEKEAELSMNYSERIKNEQAAIANLQLAIERQQSVIDNLQSLIKAEEEKTAE